VNFRYQHGIGLPRDMETAAQYAVRAASVSSEAFHRVGGQPIMESDRIDDNTEREVAKGVIHYIYLRTNMNVYNSMKYFV
jgi:hypothetical protein